MKTSSDELPPCIPEQLPDIDMAVRLLGHRIQHNQLKPEDKTQLRKLLGILPPSKKHAETWKQSLKALAREMRDMGDSAPQPRRRKRTDAHQRLAESSVYRGPEVRR